MRLQGLPRAARARSRWTCTRSTSSSPSRTPGRALDVWTCDSLRNKTNVLQRRYDRLIERVRRRADRGGRSDLCARRTSCSGATAQMPRHTARSGPKFTNLESIPMKDTFAIDPLGRIDLAAVRIN